VRHAPGYDKYASLAPGAAAHEAGYDAFMTGACFAALAHQRAAGNSQVPGTATAAAATGGGAVTDSAQTPGVNGSAAAGAGSQGTDPAPPPPPAAAVTEAGAEVIRVLQPFVGRVPLGRSDIPYASLFGVDVVPDRPRVFFVEGLPLDLPFGVLNRALAPALQATQVGMGGWVG
jgi:poly(A)-specific ribonuclease